MEEKEVVLESVEQFEEYLKKNADDKSIVSVVLELAGNETDTEGGDTNGCLFLLLIFFQKLPKYYQNSFLLFHYLFYLHYYIIYTPHKQS